MADGMPVMLAAISIEPRIGSNYPPELAAAVAGRAKRVLGDTFGLTLFGVNHVTLAPGAASSHRHWHEIEDEFVYVLEGQVTLRDDDGEHILTPGMCAGFKAGVAKGHCLLNKTEWPAIYLEIGTRSPDENTHYPDIDMRGVKTAGKFAFTRKDGSAI